ncbi:hypothetical protein LUX57_29245 [Actinomadura madurae]|nr:hypothetical protein [Actinomadura madurae]MCP9968754.1 hypothetical protein [Actinomadura madurae]
MTSRAERGVQRDPPDGDRARVDAPFFEGRAREPQHQVIEMAPLEVHPVGAGAVEQGQVAGQQNGLAAVLLRDGPAVQLHGEQA